MVQDELPMPRDIQVGVLQDSVLAPTLYSLYINDTHQNTGIYLAPFASDTYLYTTDREEGYVL